MSGLLLRSSVDAYVNEGDPAQRYPQSAKLQMRADSPRRFAYLFFAKPFPLAAFVPVAVISATLRVNLAGSWSGTQTIQVNRVNESWREGATTWNNRANIVSGLGSNEATSDPIIDAADKSEVEIDISDMLQDVAQGSPWYGIRLATPDHAGSIRSIYSSDHPNVSLRPTLEVDWGEAPDPPSNLKPGGGRAISVAKPTLDWQFSERGGRNAESTQSASRVQISSSPTFATTLYDSNKVANTQSRWDLGLTPYGGLADDEVVYWRVMVWDNTDLASEWSDSFSFTRKSKGTLAIVNPPAPPANIVNDTTPTINWDFTGRTQEAYALTLYSVHTDGDRELLRLPKTVSGQTAHTLPVRAPSQSSGGGFGSERGSKPLIKTGQTYRVRVRVFDTLDRASIAGDPDYRVGERVFTYERAGTPAPVTSLVAAPSGPLVRLTFTRSVKPDFFSLRVNGIEVLHRIDPDAVHVSGTTYRLDYWEATPRAEYTYEVEAGDTIDGVTQVSDGNATAVATTTPTGIWLIDPDDSLAVKIDGQDPADIAIRETGETFDVLGSRQPVRIVDAIMGYSGTIAGTLISRQSREELLELKHRQVPLRLVISDLNLLVVLEDDLGVSPTPNPGTRLYEVSGSFFQVDEFFEGDLAAAGIVIEPPPDDPPPPVTDDSALLGDLQPGAGVPGN